jgi:hypothetical protein
MSVDVKDADVKKLKLGEEVTIVCKGTVKELNLGDKEIEDEKKKKRDKDSCCCGISYHSPSRMTIELSSQKVEGKENTFSAMLKDEEEDD